MEITENWINVLPYMIHHARRERKRVEEFEGLISQHPASAAEYAVVCIENTWEEAEDTIATDADASYVYALKVIKGRWEKGEEAISNKGNVGLEYALKVIKGRFEKAEPAISLNPSLSLDYARKVLNGRFVAGEAAIANTQTANHILVKNYYNLVIKNPSDWESWSEDELKLSPCWMYLYAKDYLKGRLPDVLHNHMVVFGITLPNDYYVKRYFKAKRYQKKFKYRRKKKLV